MPQIVQIIGTRPQYMKLVSIPESLVIDTGQHYSSELTYDKSKVHVTLTFTKNIHNMLRQLDKAFESFITDDFDAPSLVVVYGDTLSTYIGALWAKKWHTKLAHVEAGIRTNVQSIEERIRSKVDQMSDILFFPNSRAFGNCYTLLASNREKSGYIVGDMMYENFLNNRPNNGVSILTIHRRENLPNLQNILDDLPVEEMVFYVHPHTYKYVCENKIRIPNHIRLSDPVGYKTMMKVLQKVKRLYTDSGGLVKEAYWSGCPVTFLGTNPWPEIELFGDGKTSEKIREVLLKEVN